MNLSVSKICIFVGFYGISTGKSIASGTIIDSDGTILTCAHAVVDSSDGKVSDCLYAIHKITIILCHISEQNLCNFDFIDSLIKCFMLLHSCKIEFLYSILAFTCISHLLNIVKDGVLLVHDNSVFKLHSFKLV